LVGSDAHLWPGPTTPAFRGFIKFCKEMQPKAVILNGDVLDFPQISRHPPIGWQRQPTVQEEIEAAQEKLGELEAATFKAAKVWTLGNHCQRYETRLATVAPEYAKLKGYSLRDWFPLWAPCWSAWINPDQSDGVVVKHRWKGGMGATRANALNSGRHMVTGHLHSANVRGVTDYNGTRWGVDTGCLAEPSHEAFVSYTEDAPLDWRSAFGVLTFHKGKLMQPELVLKWSDTSVQFRGEIISV
jgi:UDP-2,3-diacylglucosamine pyrophosphatase LpxH